MEVKTMNMSTVKDTKLETKKKNTDIFKNYQLYLMLLPGIIYVFLFHYISIYGVQIAFRDFEAVKGFWGSDWVGMANINRFFRSPDFTTIIWNTLSISLYQLIIGFPLPIILALFLNHCPSNRFRKIVQNITYAPHFISVVVLVGMLLVMMSPRGVFSTMVKWTGAAPELYMGKPEYFRHIFVWSGIWQSLGWNSIIYIAALSGVSPELHEASIVDGANKLERIWHIDLPTIIPTAVILLVLAAGGLMSVGFEKAFLMQNSMNITRSEIISTYIYKKGLMDVDYSFSTAVGLFNNVINFILLITVNKIAKKLTDSSLW
jgi:putative aldouronate transport system permease protein